MVETLWEIKGISLLLAWQQNVQIVTTEDQNNLPYIVDEKIFKSPSSRWICSDSWTLSGRFDVIRRYFIESQGVKHYLGLNSVYIKDLLKVHEYKWQKQKRIVILFWQIWRFSFMGMKKDLVLIHTLQSNGYSESFINNAYSSEFLSQNSLCDNNKWRMETMVSGT